MARACRAMFERLDDVATRITDAIVAEIPEFGPGSPFDADDVRRSVSHTSADFLQGVASNRSPRPDEIAFRRHLGRRGAALGFPLEPLLVSYQIGYRELWSMLVEEVVAVGGDAPMLLLRGGSILWERLQVTSASVAEGHREETARLVALGMRTAAAFFEAVVEDPASDRCLSLVYELGLRPDATCVALSIGDRDPLDKTARAFIDSLRAAGDAVISGIYRGHTAVLCQAPAEDAVRAAVAAADGALVIGVGRCVEGLEGCRRSLAEAELAREVAVIEGGPCRFEDHWLSALGLHHRGSVEPMLRAGIDAAKANAHLVDAVRAFADSGFQITDAARQLHLAPSSFRYRLTRWRELTGWDPWTHDGLTRSLLALQLAR